MLQLYCGIYLCIMQKIDYNLEALMISFMH